MKENSVLRKEARASLEGNWATSALFMLVYYLAVVLFSALCSLLSLLDFLGSISAELIGILVCLPLAYGLTVGFLHQFRGQEQHLGMLACGYTQRIWSTVFLQFIYRFFWTLLLVVPGIMKGYSYAMTPYILADEPGLSGNAAIEKSMALMEGHKMKLFLLDLSFLGWYLLALLTLSIGLLWLIPYKESSHAAFYENLKKEAVA